MPDSKPSPAKNAASGEPKAPVAWRAADDETLLRCMAAGESGAFDELFARYSAAVLSFLSRLASGKCDPEDILQETFLRILTHAAEFRSGTAFRPWLFTIARNAAYNAIKKSRLRAELEVKTDLSDWQPPVRDDPSADPSARAERDELRARVLAALEELPAPHREILVLTLFESFSYEEASAITGDPESTLRSRVFYALRKLRDRLKEPT